MGELGSQAEMAPGILGKKGDESCQGPTQLFYGYGITGAAGLEAGFLWFSFFNDFLYLFQDLLQIHIEA